MTTEANVKTAASQLYETLERIRSLVAKALEQGEISSAAALDQIDEIATLACAAHWRRPEMVAIEWGEDPLGAWHGRNE